MLGARHQVCCDRIAGAATGACASRRQLKAAVLRARDLPAGSDPVTVPFPAAGREPRVTFGTVRDVSPHVLVIGSDDGGEKRITLTPDASAWRGGALDPAAVQPGDWAVVRLHPRLRDVADRIWANIGRVTGTIIECYADSLLVDEGATRPRQVVTIPSRAAGRIRVRFPSLESGYLIDVIGLRRGAAVEARIPATSQPAYPVGHLPPPVIVAGQPPSSISGSATWHEPAQEPSGLLGVAYPALDPEAGCAEGPAGSEVPGFARLPYLAIGSQVVVRNDCTGSSHQFPVTGCATVARLFNDRCVTCGTSPRGRVADLTMAGFVTLGGELERGCFNTTITIGR